MIKAPAGVRVTEPTYGQGVEEPSVIREDILQLMVLGKLPLRRTNTCRGSIFPFSHSIPD
jgi:hypothetical protein